MIVLKIHKAGSSVYGCVKLDAVSIIVLILLIQCPGMFLNFNLINLLCLLQLNLKFEVEVLCNTLSLEMKVNS